MFGTHLILPFITMIAGALFAVRVNGETAIFWGGLIGFGVGCAILAVVWLFFSILGRMVE
jgi:hypothetical protein